METIKIAPLKIKGLVSPTRVNTLEGFLRQQDIDILFIQEVTHHNLDDLRGYTTHYNVGTTMRGAALIKRDEMTLAEVTKIPSGRAIAAEFRGMWLMNIYAPSGAARR